MLNVLQFNCQVMINGIIQMYLFVWLLVVAQIKCQSNQIQDNWNIQYKTYDFPEFCNQMDKNLKENYKNCQQNNWKRFQMSNEKLVSWIFGLINRI